MNKLMMPVAMVGTVVTLLSGCSTVDPLMVEQTERDLKAYQESNVKPIREGQYKVAIRCMLNEVHVKDLKKNLERSERLATEVPKAKAALMAITDEKARKEAEENYKSLKSHVSDLKKERDALNLVPNKLESALTDNLSNLGWFEPVDRKNGVALAGEAALAGDGIDYANMPSADLVLIADTKVSYVAKQGWKRTSIAAKARGVLLETNFRLIDIATKQPVLSRTVRASVCDTAKGGLTEAIALTANRNAKSFARSVAAKFLPGVTVLQTRGDGRYAQVAMGKNYQATPAISTWKWWPFKYLPLCYVKTEDFPASRIDFFTVEKNGEKLDDNVFAHGSVLRADSKKAWIEVENFEKADVHKGHSAKISEEIVEDDDLELE